MQLTRRPTRTHLQHRHSSLHDARHPRPLGPGGGGGGGGKKGGGEQAEAAAEEAAEPPEFDPAEFERWAAALGARGVGRGAAHARGGSS